MHQMMKLCQLVFFLTSLLYLLHAGYEERAFFGDGLHYFIGMVESGGFSWHEPSRRIAHIVMKIPVVLAMQTGIRDFHFLARLYSLSLLVFPLLFTCIACLCLPKEKGYLFVYPVMIYLAGIAASSFYPIGEAQFGATYFWLIAFLLMYNPVQTWLSRLFIFALCLPVILVHEAYSFLGILLLLVCAYRYSTSLTQSDRKFFIILCCWFIVVVLFNLYNVIEPRSPENRAGFIQGTLTLRFLGDFHPLFSPGKWKINGPAFLGIMGLGAMFLLISLCQRSYIKIILKLIVLVCSLYICVDIFNSCRTFWPGMQTNARAHGAILSALVFPAMLYVERYAHQKFMISFKEICQVIILISVAQMVWHTGATLHWSNYLHTIDSDLTRSTGVIAFEDSSISNNFINGRPIKRMVLGHTIPCLSITRAEHGMVKAIIDFPPNVRWQPCNPYKPDELPRLPGFTYRPFIQALNAGNQKGGQ